MTMSTTSVRTDATAASTITAKGPTDVPADVRAFVEAKPCTRLARSAMPDGIIVRAKTKSIVGTTGRTAPASGRIRSFPLPGRACRQNKNDRPGTTADLRRESSLVH